MRACARCASWIRRSRSPPSLGSSLPPTRRTPICGAGYECGRYQVVLAAPRCHLGHRGYLPGCGSEVGASHVATAGCRCLRYCRSLDPVGWLEPVLLAGRLQETGFRAWEWVAAFASLAGIGAIRIRGGRFRFPAKAKSRTLLFAFFPALVLLTLDFVLQSVGTLRLEGSSLSTPGCCWRPISGWDGGSSPSPAPRWRYNKESRNEAEHGKPHHL